MIVTLDWETYYDSKDYTLSKVGPIEYVRDPRFTELCLGYRIDRGDTIVVDAERIHDTLLALDLENPANLVVGHNIAGFDGLILSEVHGIHPHNIIDTMHMARWCGISRVIAESHKALTDFLGHGMKKEGTVVSNGKRYREDFTPDEWAFFRQYCADDVTQCSENFFSMLPYMTNDALLFGSLTARMATEPAIEIDAAMIEQYIKDIDAHADEVMQEIGRDFGLHNREEFLKAIRSSDKFCSMLRYYGAEPPMKVSEAKTKTRKTQLFNAARDARNKGLDDSLILKAMDRCEVMAPALSKADLDFKAMASDPNEHIAALVQARLELNSSIERSRAVRLLGAAKSGRPLPVMLKAFYAHTGRYGAGSAEGSDSLNMQNLSKRDPSKLTLRRALKAPAGHKFVSVDSSQIEARMLAYAAGELGLVEQFREGRDPYAELAEKIFGISAKEIHDGAKNGDKKLKNYRNVGKTCILSCFTPNTLVLTNHGWKQIACVTLKDRVWDGDNYVQHKGVVCQGLRQVVDFFGTYCTEEHQFFNGAEWHTAKDYLDGDFDFDSVFEYGKKHVPSDAFLQYTIVLGDERDTRMTLQWPQIPGVEYSYSVETPVFDILHAGPQHRFMVLTENGPAIAHNCGYGVGSQKFSDTLLRQGVRLSDDLEKHHELAKQAHQIYRLSNRMIVAFWDECQRVIEAMESGAEGWFGGPDGKLFHYMQASLPGHEDKIPCIVVSGSEYKLWYPNLQWEKGEKRVEYFYDRVHGKNLIKTKTYGGACAENCIQSLAFMLLGWQACRMSIAGVPLIANIHDAWLSCVPESDAEETMKLMEHWMSSVPSWLEGFPVACEGEIGDSYEIA